MEFKKYCVVFTSLSEIVRQTHPCSLEAAWDTTQKLTAVGKFNFVIFLDSQK